MNEPVSKKKFLEDEPQQMTLNDLMQEDPTYAGFFGLGVFDKQYIDVDREELLPTDLTELSRMNSLEAEALSPEVLQGALRRKRGEAEEPGAAAEAELEARKEEEKERIERSAESTADLLSKAMAEDKTAERKGFFSPLRKVFGLDKWRTKRDRTRFLKKARDKRLEATKVAEKGLKKIGQGGDATKERCKAVILTAEAQKQFWRAVTTDKSEEEFHLLCTDMKAYRQILKVCESNPEANAGLMRATIEKMNRCREMISNLEYVKRGWKANRANPDKKAEMDAAVSKEKARAKWVQAGGMREESENPLLDDDTSTYAPEEVSYMERMARRQEMQESLLDRAPVYDPDQMEEDVSEMADSLLDKAPVHETEEISEMERMARRQEMQESLLDNAPVYNPDLTEEEKKIVEASSWKKGVIHWKKGVIPKH